MAALPSPARCVAVTRATVLLHAGEWEDCYPTLFLPPQAFAATSNCTCSCTRVASARRVDEREDVVSTCSSGATVGARMAHGGLVCVGLARQGGVPPSAARAQVFRIRCRAPASATARQVLSLFGEDSLGDKSGSGACSEEEASCAACTATAVSAPGAVALRLLLGEVEAASPLPPHLALAITPLDPAALPVVAGAGAAAAAAAAARAAAAEPTRPLARVKLGPLPSAPLDADAGAWKTLRLLAGAGAAAAAEAVTGVSLTTLAAYHASDSAEEAVPAADQLPLIGTGDCATLLHMLLDGIVVCPCAPQVLHLPASCLPPRGGASGEGLTYLLQLQQEADQFNSNSDASFVRLSLRGALAGDAIVCPPPALLPPPPRRAAASASCDGAGCCAACEALQGFDMRLLGGLYGVLGRPLSRVSSGAARRPSCPACSAPPLSLSAPSSAMLLTGAPGSGKSFLLDSLTVAAPALLAPASVAAFRIDALALLGSEAGAAEEALALTAAGAVAHALSGTPAAPARALVIIDNVETLFPPPVPPPAAAAWVGGGTGAGSSGGARVSPLLARLTALAAQLMDETAAASSSCAAGAVTWVLSAPSSLHLSPAVASRCEAVLEVPMPDTDTRAALLQRLLGSGKSGYSASLASWVAARTHGYTPADLVGLHRAAVRAAASATTSGTPRAPLDESAFRAALAISAPSLLTVHRSLTASAAAAAGGAAAPTASSSSSSSSAFAGLIGIDAAVAAARAAVLFPLEAVSEFAAVGLSPPRGLLITGPPGSGKTALAQALAAEAAATGAANVLTVQGTDLVSAEVGATEAAVAGLFARARALSPCLLVIDAFECLAPRRTPVVQSMRKGATGVDKSDSEDDGSDGSETTDDNDSDEDDGAGGGPVSLHRAADRLLSVLLTEMDGVGTAGGGGQQGAAAAFASPALLPPSSSSTPLVIVVAVTRDASLLDPAVTRPGRIDSKVALALPDAAGRAALLGSLFTSCGQGEDAGVFEAALSTLVAATEGWTPADLCALRQEAGMRALRRVLPAGAGAAADGKAAITREDVTAAYAAIKGHIAARK